MNRRQRRGADKLGRAPQTFVAKNAKAAIDPTIKMAELLSSALKFYSGEQWPDAVGFAELGNLLREKGMLPEAEACLRQAVALSPNFAAAHNNLGGVLDLQGKLTEAALCYGRALVLNPDLGDVHYNLGNVLREQGKTTDALMAYDRAAALGQSTAKHMAAVLRKETTERPPQEYVSGLFDFYAAGYESHLVGTLGYKTPQILRRMLGKQHPGMRFSQTIDLGCGTGLMGAAIHDLTDYLVGVDLAPNMIARSAEKMVYDRLVTADVIQFLNRESEAFDLFIAAELLVYIGALDELFRGIEQRARPHSRLVFSAEILETGDYALCDSGRYAYSRTYLEAQLAMIGADVLAWETQAIRLQAGKPLHGHHIVAAFPG